MAPRKICKLAEQAIEIRRGIWTELFEKCGNEDRVSFEDISRTGLSNPFTDRDVWDLWSGMLKSNRQALMNAIHVDLGLEAAGEATEPDGETALPPSS